MGNSVPLSTELIRYATPADAAQLSAFARDIFRKTFGPDNLPRDIDAYLAEAFIPALQEQEIRDPDTIVLLLEHAGAVEGYAHLVRAGLESIQADRPVELRRFYIARRLQGTGAAHRLMARVLEESRAVGGDLVWLGVWERNPRAIAFYIRHGFERVGEHQFMLGTDLQLDWLMARPVERAVDTGRPPR
ncbi:MAG: GNAT family N-acetyltransferase [Gemmatimonadaceae bacterium]